MSRKIALITDSTADLPPALAAERGIYVIPQVVVWGQETLKAGIDIDSQTFYERLAGESALPTTSRPAPADVAALCQQAMDDGAEDVLILTVSAEVSGSFGAAEQAQKMLDFPVKIIDTRTISVAQGLTVLAVADLLDSGASLAEAAAASQETAARSRMFFTPSTLEYLHRGGRIGGAQRLIGTALSIKPILHISDGRVEAFESVRTRKRAVSRLVEIIGELVDTNKPFQVGVTHGNTPDEAAALRDEIASTWNPQHLLTGEVDASIGVHVGPGVLGIGVLQ